jgi:hypothetical protein
MAGFAPFCRFAALVGNCAPAQRMLRAVHTSAGNRLFGFAAVLQRIRCAGLGCHNIALAALKLYQPALANDEQADGIQPAFHRYLVGVIAWRLFWQHGGIGPADIILGWPDFDAGPSANIAASLTQ